MSTFWVYFLFSTACSVWPFLWFEWYDNYHTNKSKEGNNNTSPITPPLTAPRWNLQCLHPHSSHTRQNPLAWDSARPWQSSVETTLWIRAWAVEKLRSSQFWWTFSSRMVFLGTSLFVTYFVELPLNHRKWMEVQLNGHSGDSTPVSEKTYVPLLWFLENST